MGTAAKKPDEPARKLVSHVFVDDQWYGPDDDLPADVAERITNESAWSTPEA